MNEGNTLPRIEVRSLKKLKNMAARLRERVAFGNCDTSRYKALERLKHVVNAIRQREKENNYGNNQ